MSWWSSGWTDLAQQAIKNAQHKIDKALDIENTEEAEEDTNVPSKSTDAESKTTENVKKEDSSSEFWNSWLQSSPSSSSSSKPTQSSVESKLKEAQEQNEALKSSDLSTSKKFTQKENVSKKFADDKQKEKLKPSPSKKSADGKQKDKLKPSPRSPISKSTTSSKSNDSSDWEFGWGPKLDNVNKDTDDPWSSFDLSENVKQTAIKEKTKDVKTSALSSQLADNFEVLTQTEESTHDTVVDISKEDEVQLSLDSDNTIPKADEAKCDDTITIDKGDISDSQKLKTEKSVIISTDSSENVISLPKSDDLQVNREIDKTLLTFVEESDDKQGITCTLTNLTVTSDVAVPVEQSESFTASDTTILTLSETDSQSSVINSPEDQTNSRQQDSITHQDSLTSIPTETNSVNNSVTSVLQTCNEMPGTSEQFSENVNSSIVHCDTLTSVDNLQIDSSESGNTISTQEIPDIITTDTASLVLEDQDSVIVPTEKEQASATAEENKVLDSSLGTSNSGDTLTDNIDDNNLENESLEESYVNVSCMMEEAMEDMPSKPDGYGSDNHSNGEKSESSKLESEIDKSVSGHDSSDDIETTTSSDIEIISTPTSNGEYKLFDLSPLKLALQKTVQRGSTSHRRTDSQSSSSTYSKAGESDQLSPGRDSLERQEGDSGDDLDVEHHRHTSHEQHSGDQKAPELSVVSEENSNPYQTDKLLKTALKQDMEIVKKLAEMAEVLQARENKLVQLSKENNDMLEANSILRHQLEQSEAAHEAKMEDVDSITEEFKNRITEGERKLNAVIKEKENLKKQLKSVQDELHKKINDRSQQKLMEEKDEQIKDLLEEGEKLSKQQLQSNNIIKKLRAKEKENDGLVTSQKSKIEEMKKELEHLRKVCDSKADLEKKQTDAINQLNSAVQKQEKELVKYRTEEEDYQEKLRSLQAALDNSYKEIAELHKANAAQDSKATEIAQSLEIQIKEEAQFALNKELMKARQEKEDLIMQIEDLRISMARLEKEHNRKEDMLRQDIADLRFQLQADELRNQELSQNVSSTTRPLLRQIENLQAAYKSQGTSFEKVEKNLSDRLSENQNQLAIATDKERTASEKLMEITSQITSLEIHNSRLKQEKSQLVVQSGLDKTKIEMLEDAKQNETVHIEAIKTQMTKEITELKRDKVFLESQVEMEKNKFESEKRRCAVVEDQLKIIERERPKSRGTPSPISISRQDSLSSFTDQPPPPPLLSSSLHQDEILERSLYMTSAHNNKSVYEQLRHTGATALIEGLESQLKLREGEITQLQSEISQLERTRESMAKELVNLTNQNEELEEKLKDYPELITNYKELDSRYNAILQMYGEKVEETEELKLDLADIKEMYKQQINHLLTK